MMESSDPTEVGALKALTMKVNPNMVQALGGAPAFECASTKPFT
jgi:hypothetical protein